MHADVEHLGLGGAVGADAAHAHKVGAVFDHEELASRGPEVLLDIGEEREAGRWLRGDR